MASKFYPGSNSFLLLLISFIFFSPTFAQNPIVTENALPGNPIAEWGVPDFRDNRIAGFSTKMSLNAGETVRFKINVQAGASYTLKIYRLGYYGGNGARLMQNLGVLTGTIQPAGLSDPVTGVLDCSNWSESASWVIPATAVSGFYIAKLERTGGGSNHIAFIVRNDASHSDLYLQFPDATWQAYNGYGGNSLYAGNTVNPDGTLRPGGHAVKVSYNRPVFPYNSLFNTDGKEADWYMNAAYPMIRWVERNGYHITYTSSNDIATNPARILNHKVFISLGHDEYWSKEQRNNIEAALNAGVHLAFLSGNEVYWKTRWETLVGGEHRTLVCYKEGTMGDGSISEVACGTKCDASTNVWTGLWRTGADYDAGKPENALTGQISWTETYGTGIDVPAKYKKLRFWRNTSIASLTAGQTKNLPPGTLGFEWDFEQYFSNYPAARITMSSTTINNLTHKLSLYKHNSGALVFGAGTVQWSWGLDEQHWGGFQTTSPEIQQATVNLFADMGVQPATLQAGLTAATKSTDNAAPASVITSPVNGSTTPAGSSLTISGTATDAGGVVAGVEVSTDGGSTWRQADINVIDAAITWSFAWVPSTEGSATIKTRAFDDSGNKETPGAGTTITIGQAVCPCTIFNLTSVPAKPLANDGLGGIEVGVKFETTQNGFITGIRYYKGMGTTGTHTGSLWSNTGSLLAQATFVNETTSGWQQVLFSSPVSITAGVTYIASYHSSSGDYASTNPFFTQAVVNGPLRALPSGEEGPNGVFQYTASPVFPTNGFQSINYWVDVVFTNGSDVIKPVITLHPSAQVICEGKSVSLTSAATGKPAPTVQWQSSINGTDWSNIAGATNSTLTFIAAATDNNKLYRAVWTNSAGTVNSNAVKLTVKAKPVLTSKLVATVSSGNKFVYIPTGSIAGTVFTWKRAAVPGIANTASSGTGKIEETLVNTAGRAVNVVYVYTLTANGCSNTQNVVVTVGAGADECVIKSSIESDFNSTSIAAGHYIWFNSSLKPGDFVEASDTRPYIAIKVTNSWISFKASGRTYTLKVPDSYIRYDQTVRSASTKFINNAWEIAVPRRFDKDVFVSGLAYRVPVNLPGNIKDIKWTADIGINKGVTIGWRWSAAVYTSFAAHAGLKIKPIDGNKENPYPNSNKEGTPENFVKYVVGGATGKGKTDYTGHHSKKRIVYCNSKNDKGQEDEKDDEDRPDANTSRSLTRQLPSFLADASLNDSIVIQASPNPSTNQFTVSINAKASNLLTVTISDVFGNILEKHERVASTKVLQVGATYKPGVYFVAVTQGDQRKTVMIIKSN